MTRIIGVVSGKGGVGKTVVSINLAASLYKYFKKRVLVVDANVTTPHLGLYLGLYSTPITFNDATKGIVEIEKAVYEHSYGIHVLPASLRIEDMKDVNWHMAKEKLDKIINDYDIVLLDSSPGFNREALITLGACHEVIMVTNPIIHSAADLIKCNDISKELNVKPLGIILNMVRNKSYEISRCDVEGLVDMNVLCSIPYEDKITESILRKRPAIEYSRKMDREIMKAAAIITGEQPKIKQNVFSRIFRI